MKKILLIAAIAGAGYVAWKYWQSMQEEKALSWASVTDSLD